MEHLDPIACETLWAAVVRQAIADACATPSLYTKQSEIDHARSWLTTNSRDFIEVCQLAGIEPFKVRQIVKRVRGDGWKAEFTAVWCL